MKRADNATRVERGLGDGDDAFDQLGLLASAMAAREVRVAATTGGEPAWTDGTTVYIDVDDAPSSRLQALAVQASLIAAGSLEADALRQLKRYRTCTRYLAVEAHRALLVNEPYLPRSVCGIIDRDVASSVDGVEASLAVALGREPVATAPPAFGELHPRRVLTATEGAEPGTGEIASLGREPDDADERDEREPPDLGPLLTSPVGGGGPVGRLLQRLFDQTRRRGRGGPPGADSPTRVADRPGSAARGVTTGRAAPPSLESSSERRRSRLTYPEWDLNRKRYRPDWCTVTECDPPAGSRPSTIMPDGLTLRRPLSRLGMGLVPCHRQLQGDDIDIDAAVEARVAVLASSVPSEALYVESLRRRRDLSVLILLDVSGSAGEPGTMGKPVHDHQRSAAAELTTALHDLGDRVALYAFNSQGRASVRVMRVKSFDDGVDSRVGQRLGDLVPSAYTRLGAAIRHGATLVEEQGGTPRRLLVVLSDGLAYDHGYEGRYGEADARRALSESRRRGIGCLCLSVGASVEVSALRRVFGTAAHASVPSAGHLPSVIGPLFRAALRSAEAQRRVHRRTERTRERLEIERRAS